VATFENVLMADVWLSRVDNHLKVTVAGTNDQLTINNWYLGENYQVDQIQAGSAVLYKEQVEPLVSAMSTYDVPYGESNGITQEVKDELQPLLETVWLI
jgi:Haemolysin-type calcium binding protein related domain